jgi:hypothetical protein
MNSFYQGLAQHKFNHLHNRDDVSVNFPEPLF